MVEPVFVTVHGRELAVREHGSGPRVLFVHGIPTSSLLWEDVQPAVAATAATCAVDLLGYGRSAKPADLEPSLPVQAELLAGLLDAREWDDVTVVGHDIGGGVAQLLALRATRRIRALVLVDSIAYDSFPEPTIARLADPVWDDRILGANLVRGFAKSLSAGTSLPPERIDRLARRYADPFDGDEGRRAYLRAARALHTGDLAARMPEVERLPIPVHVVWGSDDQFQPVGYAHRLHAAIPTSTLRIIDDAGHFLPHDRPEAITETILAALP